MHRTNRVIRVVHTIFLRLAAFRNFLNYFIFPKFCNLAVPLNANCMINTFTSQILSALGSSSRSKGVTSFSALRSCNFIETMLNFRPTKQAKKGRIRHNSPGIPFCLLAKTKAPPLVLYWAFCCLLKAKILDSPRVFVVTHELLWPQKVGYPRNSCPKTCFKSSCEIHPVPWKSKKLKSSCHAVCRLSWIAGRSFFGVGSEKFPSVFVGDFFTCRFFLFAGNERCGLLKRHLLLGEIENTWSDDCCMKLAQKSGKISWISSYFPWRFFEYLTRKMLYIYTLE